MAIPIALSVAGTAVSAYGSIYQANAQAAGLKSAAAWKQRQAAVEQMKTSFAIQQKRRQQAATLASQTLQYAGSGIRPGEGTPNVVADATIEASELDIQARGFAGDEEVNRLEFEAANDLVQAGNVKKAGQIGAFASVIGGAGKIFSSAPGTSLLNSAFSVGTPGPSTTFTQMSGVA
jgi:hypothetical protein